jgi:hypothetical protein
MGPCLGDREKLTLNGGLLAEIEAAMEPCLGDREKSSWWPGKTGKAACRNGALPWRQGEARCVSRQGLVNVLPQWSPALETGRSLIDKPGLYPNTRDLSSDDSRML